MASREKLVAALGPPGLAWLLARLRRRLELGEPLTGIVRLDEASEEQREAVGALLGRRAGRGGAVSVDLAKLEQVLVEAGLCQDLQEAVESLVGPVENERGRRQQEAREWAKVFDDLARRASGSEPLRAVLEEVKQTGSLRRLARDRPERARELGNQLVNLAGWIPTQRMAIAELAATVAGDAHALDPSEPLGTLALKLVAKVAGCEVAGSEARRDAWAQVGVLCDELSGPVLVLNLAVPGDTCLCRALRLHAEAGEPYRISTRQLVREPLPLEEGAAGRRVFVCENPSVVIAAANELGPRSMPLVCTEGMPRTSARLLLEQLVAAGASLHYHGDFDWPGIVMANLIRQRHGASPWRMAARDYQEAAEGGTDLVGEPVAALWDDKLEPAMSAWGRAVHEERVLEGLLSDLGSGPGLQNRA
ncbi:MAG: TIGR02679 family protein [Myxococcales bacterium]